MQIMRNETLYDRFERLYKVSFGLSSVKGFWSALSVTTVSSSIITIWIFFILNSEIGQYSEGIIGEYNWLFSMFLSAVLWFVFGNAISFFFANIISTIFFEDNLIKNYMQKYYPKYRYRNSSLAISILRIAKYNSLALIVRIMFFWAYFIPVINYAVEISITAFFIGRKCETEAKDYSEETYKTEFKGTTDRSSSFGTYFLWFAVAKGISMTVVYLSSFTIIFLPIAILFAMVLSTLENFFLMSFSISHVVDKREETLT